jgi:hypothetical protein
MQVNITSKRVRTRGQMKNHLIKLLQLIARWEYCHYRIKIQPCKKNFLLAELYLLLENIEMSLAFLVC